LLLKLETAAAHEQQNLLHGIVEVAHEENNGLEAMGQFDHSSQPLPPSGHRESQEQVDNFPSPSAPIPATSPSRKAVNTATLNLPHSVLQFRPQPLSDTAPIPARSLLIPESNPNDSQIQPGTRPTANPSGVFSGTSGEEALEPISANYKEHPAIPKKIFLTGYRIMLKKIAVINVQAAHRLKTNSLMATIVCGEGLATTKVIYPTSYYHCIRHMTIGKNA
jgi:hypothetical protein